MNSVKLNSRRITLLSAVHGFVSAASFMKERALHTIFLMTVVLAGCAEEAGSDNAVVNRIELSLQEDVIAEFGPEKSQEININIGFSGSLKQAVLQSPGYTAALASESEAISGIKFASSGLSPQVSANGTFGAEIESGATSDTTTGLVAGLTASQLIYDGGKVRSLIDQAEARAVAAKAERIQTANVIALEAARAWVDVWRSVDRLSLLDIKTAQMDELDGQINRMAANGLLDRSSLDAARRQILDNKLKRRDLVVDLEDAQARFRRYFGLDVTTVAVPPAVLDVSNTASFSEAWRTAPLLESLAAQLVVARHAVAEAQGAFSPNVTLQLGAISPEDDADTTDVTAGVRLEYVFNDGGRREARREQAYSRVEVLQRTLSDEWAASQSRMKAALSKVASIRNSLPMLEAKIEVTASEVSTARSQIATGQSNLSQLVEAELENYRAQDELIQMRTAKHMVLLDIASATGLLSRFIGLEDV